MKTVASSREYLLALAHTGMTSAMLRRLLAFCKTPEAAWYASEEVVHQVTRKDGAAHFLAARQSIQPNLVPAMYAQAGISVVFQNDSSYPELLMQTADPPLALFVQGRLEALQFKTLGVVGTRRITPYGKRATESLISGLVPYYPCIISGLAAGVDTCAHEIALKSGLPTVAVMGTAPDVIYPRQNTGLVKSIVDSGGCVITENPINAPGSKYAFPRRNRIIAGLSLGVLVVEGNQKSGALITAQNALEENRQVLAVPGSVFSPSSAGPNGLIQQGAALVQTPEDIAATLNWLPVSVERGESPVNSLAAVDAVLAGLNPVERQVLDSLPYEPQSFDRLCQTLGSLNITELNASLVMLEMQGLVSSLPGGRYCRN